MAQVSYHIANLLEKMTSADKDYRFMATNDLMSELQKDSIKLDPFIDDDSERKVVKMLLKLLEDKNGEVQNLAVKCLGPLVNKVKEFQVETIVDTLCTNMTSDNEQLRDVSSIGLKTVISELPSSSALASSVCKRITPRLTQAVSKSTDLTVRLESLDILADLLLRFGGMLVSFQQSIQESLLPQLSSQRLAVRKRTIAAIGHLVATCSNVLFEKLMQFLLDELKKNSNISTTRTYVCCVAAVSKAAGHRFGDYLPSVMNLLVNFCANIDDDELCEYCIQAFESFVLRCPKEIDPHVGTIVELCSRFVCHDPNYHYDDEDESGGMDVDKNGEIDADTSGDEEPEYSDDDDVSWKVRRAAAKCLEGILSTRREHLTELYCTVSPLLISRFKEREENVKADIFRAYISLLKHTKVAAPIYQQQVYYGSPPTSPVIMNGKDKLSFATNDDEARLLIKLLSDQVPSLVKALTRQLREKSVKTRQCCFAVLSELLSVLPGALSETFPLLIPGIQYSLYSDKHFNSNMKIETLSFLGAALSNHTPSLFHPHVSVLVPLVVQMVEDNFYKVVAEALGVVQALVCVIRPVEMPSSFDFTPYVNPLYQCVFAKLLQTDIDQEVKEKAIACMGQLVCSFGDYLNGELNKCLPVLLDRLRNEITRLTTVKALTVIAHSPLKIDLRLILADAIPELASFLRKNQRSLKLNSLQLLETLAINYSGALKPELLQVVLAEVPPLISESDLQISQMSIRLVTEILKFSPTSVAAFMSPTLSQIIVLIQSHLLQGSSIEVLLEFLKRLLISGLQSPTFADLHKMFSNIVNTNGHILHRQAFHNIACCMATLVNACPSNAVPTVQQYINTLKLPPNQQTEPTKLFCLLSLGEIGRICPKCFETFSPEQIFLEAFSSQSEEVKNAASFALGAIAAGNLEKYLPFVLHEIQSQPRRQYLLLHSLKEIISGAQAVANNDGQAASDIIRPHLNDMWEVLLAHADCNEEGTRNVVAECLGKLCLIDPVTLLPRLKECLTLPSPLARATVVTAVKFTIVDYPQTIDGLLRSCIGEFLQTLNDEDLNVRRVALVAFNSAAHNKPSLVRDLLVTLLPSLYAETKIRKELVREVEMGPFKHTVDDGLDLRKAAFECMYTLLESCLERLDIFEFLNHVEDGLKDHYDIKMLTYLMVARLATLCPTQVLQRLDRLVDPLKQTCNAKVKANAVKQEYEKQDELKRSAIRALIALQAIPESDKNPHLTELCSYIKSQPELNGLMESVQKDPGSKYHYGEHSHDMDTT